MKEKIYKYAFVVISDTRSTGENKDGCIDACQKIMPENYKMVYKSIINDDLENIENELNKLVDENIRLILTSGGTGLSKRDNTPEASLKVIEKQTPGISEAIRLISKEKTYMWALSRAVSGIKNNSLIINLPGSPKAVIESIEGSLPFLSHGLDILEGDNSGHN